jgi:hypothetical protein
LRRSQWQPVILEGESPGDIPETRVNALWSPGRCGLLPHPAQRAGFGPLATVSAAVRGFRIMICRQLWQMRHSLRVLTGQQGHPAARAVNRQDQEPTSNAARVAGPGRICFQTARNRCGLPAWPWPAFVPQLARRLRRYTPRVCATRHDILGKIETTNPSSAAPFMFVFCSPM